MKKTAKYYAKNPKARAKKKAYDTKYHSTPERKKYRRDLEKARRERGINGKGGGDLHHSKNGKLVRESVSKNRGRKEKSRKTGYKRK